MHRDFHKNRTLDFLIHFQTIPRYAMADNPQRIVLLGYRHHFNFTTYPPECHHDLKKKEAFSNLEGWRSVCGTQCLKVFAGHLTTHQGLTGPSKCLSSIPL